MFLGIGHRYYVSPQWRVLGYYATLCRRIRRLDYCVWIGYIKYICGCHFCVQYKQGEQTLRARSRSELNTYTPYAAERESAHARPDAGCFVVVHTTNPLPLAYMYETRRTYGVVSLTFGVYRGGIFFIVVGVCVSAIPCFVWGRGGLFAAPEDVGRCIMEYLYVYVHVINGNLQHVAHVRIPSFFFSVLGCDRMGWDVIY